MTSLASRSGSIGLSRRQFLHGAAALAGAPLLLPSGLRAASPNGKLAHACIGVTRMGNNDLRNFLAHPRLEVVALCDVDRQHLETAAKQVPGRGSTPTGANCTRRRAIGSTRSM